MTADLDFVMTREDAAARLDRVRTYVEQAWDDLIALHSGRAWFALGYESWDALCDGELGGARIALPASDRREVVGQMREAGMSTRAIASAVGVSNATVARDLEGVTDVTPVTGTDGKTYQPTRPAEWACHCGAQFKSAHTHCATCGDHYPEPVHCPAHTISVDTTTGEVLDGPTSPTAPRATPRKPLTDQFFDAAYDLSKATERLERLAADDRFPQNAEKVAAKYRSDLVRAVDALQGVLHRLPSA